MKVRGLELLWLSIKLGGINLGDWPSTRQRFNGPRREARRNLAVQATTTALQVQVKAPGDVLLTLGNQHRKHSVFMLEASWH
jgi:hypothetical protein